MKALRRINGAWMLTFILEFTGASCVPQKSATLIKAGELPYGQQAETSAATESDVATKTKVQVAYGKLPLSFEANQGQSDPQVKFLSRGSGYTLFLTPTEAVLALHQLHKNSLAPASGERARVRGTEPEPTEQMVLRMQLIGANPHPQVEGLEELPGKSNYLIGNDPTKWHTNIPTYARVKYHDVYPDIDLVYYGNQRQLEYDFVIAPGADPKVITLAFEGADKLEIDARGDLVLHTAGGELRLHKPRIYQEINDVKHPISGSYVLPDLETQHSKLKTHQVGFQIASYDTSQPLVIDPGLSYSTYLSDIHDSRGYGIAVDASGNAYVTGTIGDGYNSFVTKLNADGSALVYSTVLSGGADATTGYGIAVDAFGNAYVTGSTGCGGPKGPGAFAAKLSADGSDLLYSICIGGWSPGSGYGIAVDAEGNAYVTGYTGGPQYPASSCGGFVAKLDPAGSTLYFTCSIGGRDIAVDASGNAYVVGGDTDVFVKKVDATGSNLVYSISFGGSNVDVGRSIALDAAGNAYVTGWTRSADFLTTDGAFQISYGGGTCSTTSGTFPCPDAFIAKLNADGSALVYSTYLGGSGDDQGYGIAVDALGNAYVTGYVDALDTSTNFPTADPIQATYVGGRDAFVTKLSADGSELVYSTYLGGSGDDRSYDIAIDSLGNAYVTGYTASSDFPTANPIQAVHISGVDVFVTKITEAATLSADLTLIKTDSPDPVVMGSDLTYTITITNNGPDTATGVAVTDTLPTGVTFVSSSASQGTCSGTSTITCNLETISNGASATVTIVVTPTVIGGISNTAIVTGKDADFNSANNKATAVTTINPGADLLITKADSPDPVSVGSILTYTVTVSNGGPNTATGVTVQDTLPTSVTFVSVTPSQGSCLLSGDVVTCALETLATGASATVTIVVSPTAAGTLTNTASVVGNETDLNTANNAATAVTTVTQQSCPATAVLEAAPQKEITLGVLYDFRDEVLAGTSTGQRYIELFYKHAEEGVGLMVSYPELLFHTHTLLERFLPTILAIVDGQPVTLTATDVAEIEDLLDAILAHASPQLQETIQQLRSDLHSEELLSLFGISVESSQRSVLP